MHILLADDSRSAAMMVSAHLQSLGHTVTHVMDGLAAVEFFHATPPDLVLMDVVMPEMDGIEATRRIKAASGEHWVPLVIMTALSSPEELVQGLNAGADDYLIKPINLDVLTARIEAMQRIAIVQDSLFGILDSVFNGIITIDAHGIIGTFNKAAESIFGYQAGEVIGKNVKTLMPQPYRDEHDGYLQRYIAEGIPHVIGNGRKVAGRRKDGEVFPMDLAVTELRSAKRNLFIGVIRDITQEEASRAEIERLALHDALTGLPNRAYLNQVLEEMLPSQAQGLGALLFIDLDGFKPVNDQLGHEAGDQALCTVAQRLRQCLESTEHFVGRLGGDEFVVALPNLPNEDAAFAVGHRIIAAISQPMFLEGSAQACLLGASIGLAFIPHNGRTRTEILTAADDAMYEAKRSGKNRVVRA